LAALFDARGKPITVVSDNETEFTSNAILTFANNRKIEWHCIAPGKPTRNAFIEMGWLPPSPDGIAMCQGRCC